jgi:hypothetical protein
VLRIGAIAAIAVAILVVCAWLNVLRSIPLTVQALGQERHPVDFAIEFGGLDPSVSRVPVQLFYYPQTPVFGISAHWRSIVAPLRIDKITRSLKVDVQSGKVHFAAPLGLVGVSNFRLQRVDVGEQGAPYAVTASVDLNDPASVDPSKAPRGLDLPLVAESDGRLRYDGPIALWGRMENGGANPYVYSPRADVVPAQLLWDGLRSLYARIDLAPYAMAAFVVPTDWHGDGWKNEGYRLTRAHATLTDKALEISAGTSVPLPFARECGPPPEFAVVQESRIPEWSRINGLWRPVLRREWEELLRRAQPPGVAIRFVPSGGTRSLFGMESFDVLARAGGTYRLFAGCPNPDYGSLAVTWIDVIVRP